MASFVVSALKYRPETFKSVVGQDALTTTLKNAIQSNKLAHSYLFCGPRGVGKTTCARIFAKTINCEHRTEDGEACNACESCVSFNEQRSYNIHELDAASNNGVDDIRSLTEQVRIPPQVGRYSVYIIDEVHMLSQGAFNAFLKTLEEPPKHAIFILATTEKHKIIPTILSRCQIYDFNRITITDTVNHLKYVASQESVEIEESALNIIAQKSDGGMRDALSIFDQMVSFSGSHITYQDVIDNLNVLDYDYYYRLVSAFLASDVSQSLLIFNDVLNKGFDAHHFITGLSSYLRDLLVSRDPVTIQLLEVGGDIAARYQEQAMLCSPDFLFAALKISNDADLNYRISKNKRLLVELALIRIAQLSADKKKEITADDKPATIQSIAASGAATKQEAPAAATQTAAPAQQSEAAPAAAAAPAAQTATPPAQKASVASPAASSAPRPMSISINAPVRKSPEKQAESELPEQNPEGAAEVTQELVNEKWEKYIVEHSEDPGTEAFLKSHVPQLKENDQLEVVVENPFQEKELQQMNVIAYLRRELENRNLSLQIEMAPEDQVNARLSPQEIYRKMATEQPALEILRKNLEMEID